MSTTCGDRQSDESIALNLGTNSPFVGAVRLTPTNELHQIIAHSTKRRKQHIFECASSLNLSIDSPIDIDIGSVLSAFSQFEE